MIAFLQDPWPWYVSGPLIALIMFLLLWNGKSFGVSSNLRTLCTIGGAGKFSSFFRINWRAQSWNLLFVVGAAVGGWIASDFLSNGQSLQLSEATVQDLGELSIAFDGHIAPAELFTWDALLSFRGFLILVIGGFLVGFGTRWAGGCTSGHAISGLSNLQLPSLIAVVGFFVGGLIMTHLLFPIIFSS